MRTGLECLRRPSSACVLFAAATLLCASAARAQEAADGGAQPQTLDDSIEAGEAQAQGPRRQFTSWNEYKGPWFTIKVGGGLLLDTAAYAQDDNSEAQLQLEPEFKLRDARLLLKGSFPKFKRLTWSTGIMRDGPTQQWLFRETGIMVAVPELWGHFFVGRTKEGFSLNKVMVGYAGWTMERSTINDATIPILADGIKWLGYVKELGILWNAGWYVDWLSRGQTFSTYHTQGVARVAWLPIASEETGTLLHLGVGFRYGKPLDGQLQLRSRPEAFPAPYIVDTGKFAVNHTLTSSAEVYFRPGRWLFGAEYFVQRAESDEGGDPIFHGGEAVVTWLVTGETRGYNTRGGFFKQVSPTKSVLEGGVGAVEVVARVSYIDLDDGNIRGGRFWRITPMLNWYLSDNVRLEFAYGYGELDRFDLVGGTYFFQNRIQLQF